MSDPHRRTEVTREAKGKQFRLLEKRMSASQISSDSKVISICGHAGSTGCGSTMQGSGFDSSREKICWEPILTKRSFLFPVCSMHCRSWALVPCTSNCVPLVEPRHALQAWCVLAWVVGLGMAFLAFRGSFSRSWHRNLCKYGLV